MGVSDLLVERLTLLNDSLDEKLIQLAMRQHRLNREAAARYVRDEVRREVQTSLLSNMKGH